MTKQSIDLSSLSILETGVLKATGAGYSIALLKPEHLAAVKALHDFIIDALPPDEKVFMLSKDADFFKAHLSGLHGQAILGVISDGRLVGQAVITHPTAEHPATGMVDMKPVGPPETISVLQAVSVLPECRGSGLMNRMVDHWVDRASQCGRQHVIAEIDIHNKASWYAFLHGGLNLQSIGCDPDDGTLVYNAHEKTAVALAKRLTPLFNRHSASPALACPLSNIGQQQTLMAAGYVGVGYDHAGRALLMTPAPAPIPTQAA